MKIALTFALVLAASPALASEWWEGTWVPSGEACTPPVSQSIFKVTRDGIETENTYCTFDETQEIEVPRSVRFWLSCQHSGDTYPSVRVFELTQSGINVTYSTNETNAFVKCAE